MIRPSDAGEPMSSPHAETDVPAEWRDTFAEICDRHRGRLIRWLTAIFGPRDAEDIAHEALYRLYTRPGQVDNVDDAWPWLSVVARNVGRDLARHNAWSTSVDAAALSHVPDDVVVPDEVVARDEGARLAEALRSLTPRERHVIRLRDFERLPVADIAELLGLTENAVRQQLFRARRRLAGVYVDLGGDSRFGSLVAAIGLRLREAARRLSRYDDTVPPAVAALALALPAALGALGGALDSVLPGLGPGTRPASATELALGSGALAPGYDAAADARHGTGGLLPSLVSAVAPPDPHGWNPAAGPVVEVRQALPNGHVELRARDPLSTEPGRQDEHEILVMVPGTPYGVHLSGYGYQPVAGSTVCTNVHVVRCRLWNG
ncbi:MAG TPA: sigma-70 family RNA polymerase sigma factor [Frankiaceae bacterium]|jgi:RNA polymerase sigma-70 factor (ECF subfamily)|nr:sigma-70 family RNA polymerase sigma factor [Frankiaceae bacterium]